MWILRDDMVLRRSALLLLYTRFGGQIANASEPSNPREVGKRTTKVLKLVIFAIRVLTSFELAVELIN